MLIVHDELWPPVKGSWEESVEPYDVQLTKYALRKRPEEEKPVPMIILFGAHQDYTANSVLK